MDKVTKKNIYLPTNAPQYMHMKKADNHLRLSVFACVCKITKSLAVNNA